MRRRTLLRGSAALAAGTTLGLGVEVAAGAAALPTDEVLKFIPEGNLQNPDPVWTTTTVARNHALMVWDTLFGLDAKLQPQPQMIGDFGVSSDGLLWTFTLRPELTFHDGTKVRAIDAVTSINRWMQRNGYGLRIKSQLAAMTATDDATFIIRLTKPFPILPFALAKDPVFVMPERIARTSAFEQIKEYIGSGPYRFMVNEWIAGSLAAYEKFTSYVPRKESPSFTAGAKIARFDRVDWNVISDSGTAASAIEQGSEDWWQTPLVDLLPVLKATKGVKVETLDPFGEIAIIRFNFLIPPFDNVKLRRALLPAIDQSEYVTAAMGKDNGLTRTGVGVFTPGSPLANDAGLSVLSGPRDLPLARKLVAQGVMGYHYGTTGLTMARAFAARAAIDGDFLRLITLSIRWAALRVLSEISRNLGGDDEAAWDGKKVALLNEFLNGELPADLPDLTQLNAETVSEFDALYEKKHPELRARPRPKIHESKGETFGREREKLHPERLGFDERALTHALAWLDPSQALSADERGRFLALIHALLRVSLGTIPVLEDPSNQEIDGLPSEFDGWVFEVIARTVPQLSPDDNPEILWQTVLDLGAAAHDWVERFFWAWFTTGLRAAHSPTEFVRIWRSMILYALASPRWERDTYSSYRLDSMVIELLGTDGRWGTLAADSTFAPVLGTMVDVFGRAADKWFRMPRVMRNFLYFLAQPAAAQLLRPAVLWVSKAVPSYSPYDWRDDIENGLIEYLNVCWVHEQSAILDDLELKEAFLALLATVVSRGSHAAIALRDRIAGSSSA